MFIPRAASKRIRALFEAFPVVVVTGARQVGKSTLLQALYDPPLAHVTFDPMLDVENARRDPDLFLNNRPAPLILDEIQYAPELIAALKRRVDAHKRPGMYFLTGSHQWSVMRNVSESLAGRAVFFDLDGLSLAEKAGDTDASWLARYLGDPEGFVASPSRRLPETVTMYEQLWRGSLPEAHFLNAAVMPDFHAAYIRTYIERDARLAADVSDWQLFGRFVRLLSALTAQEINASHLGRELSLTPQSAKRWVDVLRSIFQWYEVPAFSANATKRVSLKAKGYVADTGVACASQAISSPQALGSHPLLGPLFETAVVSEIRKQSAQLITRPIITHWRAHSGAEVDLVLERDGRLFPIEIKAKSQPTSKDCRGIEAFIATHPLAKIAPALVIAPTHQSLRLSEHAWSLPWDSA
jgi:uncharacterized protein